MPKYDMQSSSTQINLLISILDKKIKLLTQILNLTQNQALLFEDMQNAGGTDVLSQMVDEKQKLIDEVKVLDNTFNDVYAMVKPDIATNAQDYKQLISVLQNKVAEVTDIDISLRVSEEKNRRVASLGNVKPRPRKLVRTNQNVVDRYKQNKGPYKP